MLFAFVLLMLDCSDPTVEPNSVQLKQKSAAIFGQRLRKAAAAGTQGFIKNECETFFRPREEPS